MSEAAAPARAIRARTTEPYPPAPWELRGNAHIHLLVVRESRLPGVADDFKPFVLGGYGLVAAGWVDYAGGTVDGYRELLVAVVGGWRGRPTATVTHMWVDSEVSMRGGRELWGYPKETAELEVSIDPEGIASARDERGPIAAGTFRSLITSPWRLPARGGTVQPLGGETVAIEAITIGRPSIGTGEFRPAPDGPLGFLAGARRLASFGIGDFETKFG